MEKVVCFGVMAKVKKIIPILFIHVFYISSVLGVSFNSSLKLVVVMVRILVV